MKRIVPGPESQLPFTRGEVLENDQLRVTWITSSFFGERHLRCEVKEFMAHNLAERPQQSVGGRLIREKDWLR